MRELSPQSPNTSASVPVSSSTNSFPSTLHPHHTLANRPLPLSPMTPITSASLCAEESANFNAAPPTSAHVLTSSTSNNSLGGMSYKKGMTTHPGPLPKLEENVEHSGGFLPISRTMTNQSFGSVFSPNSVASGPLSSMSPPTQQQHQASQICAHQQRGRSNTVGGIPSPYEVPDTNNGNMPPHDMHPHDMHRPGSAHSSLQQRTNGASGGCEMGGNFPRPPTHSPPPLTHSSGDMHIRVVNDHAHHHHGGGATGGAGYHHHTHPHPQHGSNADKNTNLREKTTQRSYSSSSTHGHTVHDPRLHSSMREGAVPTSEDDDMMSYTQSSDNTVYIHPPLDSDLELQSTSSYGGVTHNNEPIGRQNMDQGQPVHPHQLSHHGHQHYPGMLNGALTSPEPFDNFEGGASHMAMPHYPQAMRGREQERGRDTSKRESLFSETSTELSITSGSEKDTSPNGGCT